MYGCHNPTVDLPVTIVTSGSESDSSNVGENVKETNYRVRMFSRLFKSEVEINY